jgi:P-type Cu+ transporter
MRQEAQEVITDVVCYHCGSVCQEELYFQDRIFCCVGCKTVFEILSSNDLCEYYALDSQPGLPLRGVNDDNFSYLDEKEIRRKVVAFDADNLIRVEFYVPAIHCVSCIWLLENLQKLQHGIVRSEVNFARKTVLIDFTASEVKLSRVASLLASVGYAPKVNLENEAEATSKKGYDKTLVMKLAVAGFCFGNVMLFSFPEYLGLGHADAALQGIFSLLNVGLSIPVLLYSSIDYYKACWRSVVEKQINIDVPIAIGLLALFFRSTWDILTGFGPGYLDSFSGLVFFLLIGRWFQGKTYQSLAFDRDFKSYFPLAVQRFDKSGWTPVVIYELKRGDRIRIRHMEIVPADSILLDDNMLVDYSFVTGESRPVKIAQGDLVYAGGRLIGKPAELVVDKKTSQSHLTSLWNNDAFHKTAESKYKKIIDRAARRFTWIVMGIAMMTAVYWQVVAPTNVWLILTAVLMVACPCALALAAPFTYGNMLRVFGRNQLYLKNADVIERMASIDAVVFDKTGTVTHGERPDITLVGHLDPRVIGYIKTLTGHSTHPLSNLLHKHLRVHAAGHVSEFTEIPGKGIEGVIDGLTIRLGAPEFTGVQTPAEEKFSTVCIAVDGEPMGHYAITTSVRDGIAPMLKRLGQRCLALISGDNEADKHRMAALFSDAELLFNQGPQDKLSFIRHVQQTSGKHVLMVGDGLNDSGALKQSDVGFAVTDDTGVFTPACDGILHGSKIGSLDKFIELAKASTYILKTGFVISFAYNAIALSFAVSGHLTPLVAAILMPVSSISVVGFTSIAVNFVAKRNKL